MLQTIALNLLMDGCEAREASLFQHFWKLEEESNEKNAKEVLEKINLGG